MFLVKTKSLKDRIMKHVSTSKTPNTPNHITKHLPTTCCYTWWWLAEFTVLGMGIRHTFLIGHHMSEHLWMQDESSDFKNSSEEN